jgi:zinc/manganese transport system permease protein
MRTLAGAPLDTMASMFSHPFMRYAFLTGTSVAVACGLVGYFVVLRGQVFTGDALSHVAFTGALAALAMGIDLRVGLYVATIGVAVGMGLLGRSGRADDVVIGSVFAWVLGLGVLFLSIYTTSRSGSAGANGAAGVGVLFGSIFGLSARNAVVAALIALVVAILLLGIARPLLFATLDSAVAAARGVPVRALGVVFLALVGLTAAETTQVVGALLLVGLLAAPAATAQRLTTRPYIALCLSAALAVAATWIGLSLSYAFPRIPPSFSIIATAVGMFGGVRVVAGARAARRAARSDGAAFHPISSTGLG